MLLVKRTDELTRLLLERELINTLIVKHTRCGYNYDRRDRYKRHKEIYEAVEMALDDYILNHCE